MVKTLTQYALSAGLSLLLCACARPFDSYHPPQPVSNAKAAVVSAPVVAAAAAHPVTATIAGCSLALGALMYSFPDRLAYQHIREMGGQVVKVGDELRIVLPSDKLFVENTARLDSKYYSVLNDVTGLLRTNHCTPVSVTAYSDDVGYAKHRQRLTDAQASTIAGYLFAHDISVKRLIPKGMAESYPIAINNRVLGRTYNRRIEIRVRPAS